MVHRGRIWLDRISTSYGTQPNKVKGMTGQPELANLFSPVKIGKVELKNRLMLASMAMHFGLGDGFLTERTKNYLVRRATGGVGRKGYQIGGGIFPWLSIFAVVRATTRFSKG